MIRRLFRSWGRPLLAGAALVFAGAVCNWPQPGSPLNPMTTSPSLTSQTCSEGRATLVRAERFGAEMAGEPRQVSCP